MEGWKGDLRGCTDRAGGAPSRCPPREWIIPEAAGEERPRLRPDRRFPAGPAGPGGSEPSRAGPGPQPRPRKHLFNAPAGSAERRGLAMLVGSSAGLTPDGFYFIWVYWTICSGGREKPGAAGGCQPAWPPTGGVRGREGPGRARRPRCPAERGCPGATPSAGFVRISPRRERGRECGPGAKRQQTHG